MLFIRTYRKMYVQLTNIKELQSDCVFMKDKAYVEKTLNDIISDGVKNLQVVSDFDFTITKHTLPNGNPALSSFCLFEVCPSVPDSYKQEAFKILSYYKPIERDPSIPFDKKYQYMVEWWSKTRDILTGFPFNYEELLQVAKEYKDSLRDSAKEFLMDLNDKNIPCLVFSAGLGDSVKALMTAADIYYPNIKIISNFLNYKDGMVDGFVGKIIHIFNKNETAIKGTEYYDLVKDRSNVIVMGDSLGDSGMAEGLPHTKVLKIGFLCDNIEQNLPRYMDAFDIVLVNDQTMEVPKALLSLI